MRKPALALVAILVACTGLAVSGHAGANGRVHTTVGIGFHFGGPYWGPGYWGPGYWGGPWWGPPAYYYPAPVYVTPPEPKVYLERAEVEAAAAQPRASTDWWYYCEASRGYYPYVKSCPSGWQRVPPAPPSR